MPTGLAARVLRFAGRRRVLATVVVALVVVVAAFLALRPRPSGPSLVAAGDLGPAPRFDLENLREGGPRLRLADYRGRPVVVNVWASWCVPCRREMPVFEAAYQRYRDRVAFVGVNHQDSRRLALELVDETGVSYPSAYDPDGTVARSFGLFGMPTTLMVSPGGQLRLRRTGEMSRSELTEALDELLREG